MLFTPASPLMFRISYGLLIEWDFLWSCDFFFYLQDQTHAEAHITEDVTGCLENIYSAKVVEQSAVSVKVQRWAVTGLFLFFCQWESIWDLSLCLLVETTLLAARWRFVEMKEWNNLRHMPASKYDCTDCFWKAHLIYWDNAFFVIFKLNWICLKD